MKLKITNISDAFDGRDHFPNESDIGSVVIVVASWVESDSTIYNSNPPERMTQAERAELFAELNDDEETFSYTVYTCVNSEGRIMQLVNFEVEVVG